MLAEVNGKGKGKIKWPRRETRYPPPGQQATSPPTSSASVSLVLGGATEEGNGERKAQVAEMEWVGKGALCDRVA